MSVNRIAAIGLIFVAACAGWGVLGVTTAKRSIESHGRLASAVEALWGVPLVQEPPSFAVDIPGSDRARWVMPVKNDVAVELRADYRKKGLIWYPTYTCGFEGAYTIANSEEAAQKLRIRFNFPAKGATYDEFAMYIDDKKLLSPVDTNEGAREIFETRTGEKRHSQDRIQNPGHSGMALQNRPQSRAGSEPQPHRENQLSQR